MSSTLGETYTWLIKQGHSRADLDRSTWRQLNLFVETANEQLEREAEAVRQATNR